MAAAPVPTGPYDPIAPGRTQGTAALVPNCVNGVRLYDMSSASLSPLADAARSELLERAHRARREAWLRLLQDENAVPFWDVVVLTAADEAQVRGTPQRRTGRAHQTDTLVLCVRCMLSPGGRL